MINYNDYVGIPWVCGKSDLTGADCWGLVCIIYIDLFGIRLSHFDPTSINSSDKTTNMIEIVRDDCDDWELVVCPQEGDVVMMIGKVSLRPEHVGVYIQNGNVLHSLTREIGQSEIHNMKFLKKIFKRLEFYRYVA